MSYTGKVVPFSQFASSVQKKFSEMQKTGNLMVVDIPTDDLWSHYLASFPEGTNPVYKERAEYDCNCCRNFIKNIGRVVSIDDKGIVTSIWDVQPGGYYDIVASSMRKLVKSSKPLRPFLLNANLITSKRNEPLVYGQKNTYGNDLKGEPRTFYHFFVDMDRSYVSNDIARTAGKMSETKNMLERMVKEISEDSLESILDLIAQNSIYRGAEHKSAVSDALKIIKKYKAAKNPEFFLWDKALNPSNFGVARFRNTVVGTLASDLSEGKSLESAVASFESKVAPHNYKRTTALVTPKMIEGAKKKINELGLMDSLDRRSATANDISVNDILFIDKNSSRRAMDVFDDLQDRNKKKETAANFDKLETVSIEKFIKDILPRTTGLEILFDFGKVSRLMTLTTEATAGSKPLFAWKNPFAWYYNGGNTDSAIKERVKNAGGNVEGEVRVSLSWHNNDDLDLSLSENGGSRISYSSRRGRLGGKLDIDMNGMDGIDKNRQPVENIFYTDASRFAGGKINVHNFNLRERIDTGYQVEVEIFGESVILNAKKGLSDGAICSPGEIKKVNGKLEFEPNLKDFEIIGGASLEVWGISTGTFVPVKMVMKSPNHWEGEEGKGNEHTFFIVDGCKTDEKVRGFFNEFLKPELTEHRKVFELLAETTKVQPSEDQLSGLGFSSTTKEEIIVKVKGSVNRTIKVVL